MFIEEPVVTVPLLDKRTAEVVNDVCITKESILKVDPKKSCSPDEIPLRLLKELAEVLAEPLSKLFNACIRQKKIPDNWCKPNLSPI